MLTTSWMAKAKGICPNVGVNGLPLKGNVDTFLCKGILACFIETHRDSHRFTSMHVLMRQVRAAGIESAPSLLRP